MTTQQGNHTTVLCCTTFRRRVMSSLSSQVAVHTGANTPTHLFLFLLLNLSLFQARVTRCDVCCTDLRKVRKLSKLPQHLSVLSPFGRHILVTISLRPPIQTCKLCTCAVAGSDAAPFTAHSPSSCLLLEGVQSSMHTYYKVPCKRPLPCKRPPPTSGLKLCKG